VASELIPRAVAERVLQALSDTPVVVVNGPRQAGKTTTGDGFTFTSTPGETSTTELAYVGTEQNGRIFNR
jgi:predicted AAA+ superfamily ATPase